jgi:hypothetical protein
VFLEITSVPGEIMGKPANVNKIIIIIFIYCNWVVTRWQWMVDEVMYF